MKKLVGFRLWRLLSNTKISKKKALRTKEKQNYFKSLIDVYLLIFYGAAADW